MDQFIHVGLTSLNGVGRVFWDHAAAMFLQVGALVAVLLAADVLLRRRLRATLRYWIWMLVIVKLLVPPTFSLPTGVGHWLGPYLAPPAPAARQILGTAGSYETPRQTASPVMLARQANAGVGAARAEPVTSVAVPGEHLTWQGSAVLLWGIGVLGFTVLVLRRVSFVRRLAAQGRPAQGDAIDLLDECCRRMNIRRTVRMKLLPGAFSPAVCGLWRPTILLPQTLPARLAPENLRAVLIHELAHVKRADLWVNCVQTVLQIIYFYNPLVWLANAIVRRVREQAVDEMSLVALGAEARSYGDTLIDVAEMAFWRANPALRLVGVAESKKSLEGRIRPMITRPIPKHARLGTWGLLIVVAIAAVLLPMAQAQRQDTALPAPPSSAGQGFFAIANEVTVELVGLCQDPTAKGQSWWRPDGTPMEEPQVRGSNPSKYPVIGLLLKFTPSADVDYRCRAPLIPLPGSQWQIMNPEGQAAVLYGSNSPPTEALPSQADIEVDVAVDAWSTNPPITTMGRRPGTGPLYRRSARTPGGHEIILSGLRPDPMWNEASKAKTLIEATTTAPDVDIRLECTTTDGRLLTGHLREGPLFPDGQLLQQTFGFDASIEEMQSIAIKQRPFHHIVFRNISLRPDQRSAVTIIVVGATRGAGGALAGGDKAAARQEYSRTRLANLGKAVLLYANDHADQLPPRMENVREHLNGVELEWLAANVIYLGKDLSVSDYPGRVVAYDKTLLAEGKGTNVLCLDSHVDFEKPQELERLGIPSGRRNAMMRTYEVNRSVPDFPRAQDFSTPEAAYATINRIDQSDPAAWQKVSVAAVAGRFKREGGQRKTACARRDSGGLRPPLARLSSRCPTSRYGRGWPRPSSPRRYRCPSASRVL